MGVKNNDNNSEKISKSEYLALFLKCLVIALCLFFSIKIDFILYLMLNDYPIVLQYASLGLLPSFILLLGLSENKRKWIKVWLLYLIVILLGCGVSYGLDEYDKSITVNTSPNINLNEYLPFDENSKIVKLENSSLKLKDDLPIVDGAAAVFPVYSAFVNAVYPDTVELNDDVFVYHNTSYGYECLAAKETDIFFGAYPSEEQIVYAEEQGTEFVFTPIGSEAFVFFVHKNNPIDNLTTEQIQKIYSGEITNWKEVGGKNYEISAYQRNEGSGSQSMLKRFMGDKEIMDPPSELVNDLMFGIIDKVSDYRSKPSSIGFSFRYYVDGIIQNPDIKIVSIDGVYPSVKNIKNGTYPIVTPLYAVTYKDNENENVEKLLNWILSEEGQKIIEETGYVGIK